MNVPAPVTIGILAHAGTGNLGDEAIIASTIQNLRDRCPDAAIVGFTIVPEDTTRRHGIPAYPIRRREGSAVGTQSRPAADGERAVPSPGARERPLARIRRWMKATPIVYPVARQIRDVMATIRRVALEAVFLHRSFRCLGGVELLVVAGSGQLNDEWSGGAWGYPYTLFKWTLLARLRGAQVAYVSVGSSELKSRLSKFFIKTALRAAVYRLFRNKGSKIEMARLGLRVATDPVVPDLVFSLRLPSASDGTE